MATWARVSLTWLLLGVAAAQSVTPVNVDIDTLVPNNTSEQVGMGFNNAFPLRLIPLTEGAVASFPDVGITGSIFFGDTSNEIKVSATDIAFMSCDPSDYANQNLQAVDVLQMAISNSARAAVFYSNSSNFCNYTGGGGVNSNYKPIFSMTHAQDQAIILNGTRNDRGMSTVTINTMARLQTTNTTQSDQNNQQSGPGGPGPSTATAMIILYSITGVITALFLIIIITGAIRAHRHPERYGPRAMIGRARQSRARGLARAMLDSIPIVKFGDSEDDIPKPNDVEMAGSSTTAAPTAAGGATQTQKNEATTTEVTERTETPTPTASDGATATAAGKQRAAPEGEGEEDTQENVIAPVPKPTPTPDQPLGCSICTEDFERGEDVRVLPCNHKFHPACIDPWLLNVSGTCPLCRIDLRPPTSQNADDPDRPSDNASEGRQSPRPSGRGSPSATEGRRRSQRISMFLDPLNRLRMQDATPEERVEALRRYNERNSGGEDSRRRRLSGRVDALLGRIRRHGDAPEEHTLSPPAERSSAATPSEGESTQRSAPIPEATESPETPSTEVTPETAPATAGPSEPPGSGADQASGSK